MMKTEMKKNVVCMALSCACVSVFAAAPSLLPSEKSFKLVWQDEFDGNALDESITSACHGIMKLGGYMILFLLCRFLFRDPILGIILEITSGLSNYGFLFPTALIMGLLCFGGLSCMAQTYTVINDTDLSMTKYILHKIIQSLLMILFSALFAFLFGRKN